MAEIEDLGIDVFGLLPAPKIGPGRSPKIVSAEFAGELTSADLAMPQVSSPAKPIKAIRDSHHSLARCLATGMSEGDASAVTGYSPSRISILKADPQFKELVEFYRQGAIKEVADFRARMADMGMDALAELRERMEEKPEDFSPALLKEIVRDMADRTGHAPQRGPTSVTQVNVTLTERMQRARERVNGLSARVIEHD